MHELGITRRLVEVALERAAAAHAARIAAVHFEVGEESDVSPESLELYWPLVAHGTAAEGARLHFQAGAEPWAFRMTAIDVDAE